MFFKFIFFFAITTISIPPRLSFWRRKLSLTIRFILCLAVASRTFLPDTTIPIRATARLLRLYRIMKFSSATRALDSKTSLYSEGFVSLLFLENLLSWQDTLNYAASFFLPLARRALMICCPALVCIRLRKPCRLLRLILLGWNVRFMI